MLCCRGTRKKEENSPAVTSPTLLQTEVVASTNPAGCALHQETSHIRSSALTQPDEPRQIMQATPPAYLFRVELRSGRVRGVQHRLFTLYTIPFRVPWS